MMEHLDELTHWLYAVKGLAEDQFAAAAAHLSDCFDCADSQLHFGRLDAGLRELALVAGIPNVSEDPFEPLDPFVPDPLVPLACPSVAPFAVPLVVPLVEPFVVPW